MKSRNIPSGASCADTVLATDRRSVLVGMGLVGGAAFSYFNMPIALATPIPERRFQQLIPDVVGEWKSQNSAGLVVTANDGFQDKLYENLETRVYEGEGLPLIMLLIAYSSVQKNDVQVHRPEICYPQGGFPILSTKPAMIDVNSRNVVARELVADRGGSKERIIYWVRIGKQFPISWAEQRLAMATSNARGITPDGLLFRVSTIEEEGDFSRPALQAFIKAFAGASTPYFRDSVLF